MRAPISVIIPTLNAGPGLARTLGSLGAGLEAGLLRELIISDGGSNDETLAIVEAAGAELVQGSVGRGVQIARGIAAAEGAWLLVLHADTVLDGDWADAAHAHIAGDQAKAGYFRLRFDTGAFAAWVVAGWANLRSRLLGLPYGDQGILVSAQLLADVGGYPPLPLMEDVALARALRGRLVAVPVNARTSAAKYVREGWLRRGAKNLWLLVRYFCGADPAQLARRYQQSDRSS